MSLYVLLTGRFPFSWPGDLAPGDSNAARIQKMFARITAGQYMPLPEVSIRVEHAQNISRSTH